MKRILEVVAGNPVGGVGTFIENYSNALLTFGYTIDVLESEPVQNKKFDEIISNNKGLLYHFPSLKIKNMPKYINELNHFYEDNGSKYDLISVNAPNLAVIHLYLAKKNGINVRIVHFHSTKFAMTQLKTIRNKMLEWPLRGIATNYSFASDAIKENMEKDLKLDSQKGFIINNAFSMEDYRFSKCMRKKIRRYLGVSEKDFLLGAVGNLLPVKNQGYLLQIMNSVKFMDSDIKLIIIGDGKEREILEKFIKTNELSNVQLLGRKYNVDNFYSAMDLFLMPSKFEGLGLAALEAQSNGLNVIFSDGVPKETSILGNNVFLPTKINNIQEWCENIFKFKKTISRDYHNSEYCYGIARRSRYNINLSAKRVADYYDKLIKK